MERDRELKLAYEEFMLWKNLLVHANANIVSNTYGMNGIKVSREENLVPFLSMKVTKAFEKCLDIVEQMRNEEVPIATVERISSGQ